MAPAAIAARRCCAGAIKAAVAAPKAICVNESTQLPF
jgi:hypothetical protein